MDPIRALVLDFDGLICDTEGAQVRAARSVFADHGATFPLQRWIDVIGTETTSDMWLPWLESAATKRVDRAAARRDFKRNNDEEVARLDSNPGIVSLLDAASAIGLPCAIASSSPHRWVDPLVHALGLTGRFRDVVCREDALRAKPHPDLYLEATRRLGVRASDALALEDSRPGSLAAKRAGLRCIAVPNELTDAQDFSHVDAVIDSAARVRLQAASARGVAVVSIDTPIPTR